MCWAVAIPAALALVGQAASLNQQNKAQNAALDAQRTAFDRQQQTQKDAEAALANVKEAKGRTQQDIATAAGTPGQPQSNQNSTLLTGYQGVQDPLMLGGARLFGRNQTTNLLGA